MEKVEERNCKNCKNYVSWLPDRPDLKGCRKWDCEYAPLGGEDDDGADVNL